MLKRIVISIVSVGVGVIQLGACSSATTAVPSSQSQDAASPGVDAANDTPGEDASNTTEPDAADMQDASNDGQSPVDAAPEAAVDAGPKLDACGTGQYKIGEYGTYSGKVNVHRNTAGTWAVDSDCSSGANVNTVTYCQKFWPSATTQVDIPLEGEKPYTAGQGVAPTCGGLYPSVGVTQTACCAPNPCADGLAPVGMYATYSGKVNVHRGTYSEWQADADCSSGANVNTVAYCQKFWPKSTSQVEVSPDSSSKPFMTGGCSQTYPSNGQVQYVCCAPQ